MFKFKNVKLNYNKRLYASLKKIYGIGEQRALYVLNTLGINGFFDINALNLYFFECILILFKMNYTLEDHLKYLIRSRFNRYRDANIFKYNRFIKKYPIRGQRTHSNAKTQKIIKHKF